MVWASGPPLLFGLLLALTFGLVLELLIGLVLALFGLV